MIFLLSLNPFPHSLLFFVFSLPTDHVLQFPFLPLPLLCFVSRIEENKDKDTEKYFHFLLELLCLCKSLAVLILHLSFLCVFRAVTACCLLMLLMFITKFLKFYFPYCSSCTRKIHTNKIPHSYFPFYRLCHWDSTQMAPRKGNATMHKIHQETAIIRLILFIPLITVLFLSGSQYWDNFLFMFSDSLLIWLSNWKNFLWMYKIRGQHVLFMAFDN